MIVRDIVAAILEAARYFSAIALVGPRQSGKTTLARSLFKNHRYVSLEELDVRARATADPRRFLSELENEFGIILDEIQHAPDLLSYIQTTIDREKKKGYFIVTGSQNLLISEAISQTLAGRIATFTLLPFSIHELQTASLLKPTIEEMAFMGMYPRIYDEQAPVTITYNNYIRNYIERDVRQIKNIFDLNLFQKFLHLCAGRVGQILNISSLGNDCGVDHKTAQAWLSLLEASYIIFFLFPYYKNFGKRLIKAPKLYFVDTGIAAALLNIKSAEELAAHYLRGGLVESFIIADLFKQLYNSGQKPTLYFWRDHTGNEVDCLYEEANKLTALEIKAGQTVNQDFFKQFFYLKKIAEFPPSKNYVIYGGTEDQQWPAANVIGWSNVGALLFKKIIE